MLNPLLDTVERLDNGVIMLVGNRTLISLSLAGNDMGEEGIKALTLAVGYQMSLSQFHSSANPGNMGLMRLVVHKNHLSSDSEAIQKLSTIMSTKDLFYKPPVSPDLESMQHSST